MNDAYQHFADLEQRDKIEKAVRAGWEAFKAVDRTMHRDEITDCYDVRAAILAAIETLRQAT